MLYEDLSINEKGHLEISGVDTVDLADEFGTALYVINEDKIRENSRTYIDAMKKYCPPGSTALFASKALCFKGIYPVLDDEGMSCDVVSPGEIYTACEAGFPPEKLYFHGNNKTDDDIRFAIEKGVGYFICDNYNELDSLDRICKEKGLKQKVLLRVTPGIDPHTLEAINTGRIDCQFGIPIETGQAEDFVSHALSKESLDVKGFHSHIGSEIFEPDAFMDAVDILMRFAGAIREKTGFTAETFDLGGGFAVRYMETDPEVDIPGNIKAVSDHLKARAAEMDYPVPSMLLEPGRSIAATAGTTLYTVGGIKTIEGYRDYVTVDGGMTDDPRYALYKAPYTVVPASRMNDPRDMELTVAGRCCESGDLIQENVPLSRLERGDLIAVLGTGAYNFSMASNYNRLVRPGIVMLKDGKPRLAVRRQTYEDLVSCDL